MGPGWQTIFATTMSCGYGSRVALAPDSASALPGARLPGTTRREQRPSRIFDSIFQGLHHAGLMVRDGAGAVFRCSSRSDCGRPCERRDPYAAASRFWVEGVETACKHKARWLWAPAFAGATAVSVASELVPISPVKQPAMRRHSFAIPPHVSRGFCAFVPPSRKQRAQGMPDARCTRGRLCSKKHRRQQPRVHRNSRHSLRNGFNGFLRALPGDHAWLPPSPVRRERRLHDLSACIGAPGPHDFAVRCSIIRLRKIAPDAAASIASPAQRP